MSESSSSMSTLDWLINTVSDEHTEREETSPGTSLASDEPEVIALESEIQTNDVILAKKQAPKTSEALLININDINFDLSTKWKIRGIISFKYDIRHFTGQYGDGEIFSFDIRDHTGEITVTSFNLSSKMLQEHIEKDKCYEVSGLSIRTANETYKTLPNKLQLMSTAQTKVTEIAPLVISPRPYVFMKIEDLDSTEINSVVDIQCHVIRDYGICSGVSNERAWVKREIHVLQGNHQCRFSLWNKQAKFYNGSLARMMIKCKNVKVKWYNGSKTLSSLENTIIHVD